MTVAELIARLQRLPSDALVVVFDDYSRDAMGPVGGADLVARRIGVDQRDMPEYSAVLIYLTPSSMSEAELEEAYLRERCPACGNSPCDAGGGPESCDPQAAARRFFEEP